MAKAKPTPVATRWEAAGWGFWSIIFLITLGPFIYLAFQISYEASSVLVVVIVGFAMAAFTAGIVTVIVNTVLQARAERIRKASRPDKKKTR